LQACEPDHSTQQSARALARKLLVRLTAIRADEERRHMNVLRLRTAVFICLAVVLLIVAVSLCIVAGAASGLSDGNNLAILAALAGAAGATVNSARSFRDHIVEMQNFLSLFATVVIQPTLGANIGLATLLIISSGLAGAFGADLSKQVPWATVGAVAFAGGLSEPFFIGLVERIIRATQPRSAAARPPRA
jgi:hypothetical protein